MSLPPLGTSGDLAQKRAEVAELFETHFDLVVRYIAVRIGNIDQAEDMASETFTRAIRAVDSYKDTGAPMRAWIFRIAHNLIVDHLRKKTSSPAPVPLDELTSPPVEDRLTDLLERKEDIQQLREDMTCLNEVQRQVLALRFGAELTSEQVGQILGKRPGAVREMQSAAIKKLRQIMEDRIGSPGEANGRAV